MPEITSPRPSDRVENDPVSARVQDTRTGLAALLEEAEDARRRRAESTTDDGGSAVCAWNHFENIPTFYNWNNRPR
jgi:hypothetical protein